MEQPALDGTATLNALRRIEGTVPAFPYALVVDDEQVVRDFLKRCLEGSGILVKQAVRPRVPSSLATPSTIVGPTVFSVGAGSSFELRAMMTWPGPSVAQAVPGAIGSQDLTGPDIIIHVPTPDGGDRGRDNFAAFELNYKAGPKEVRGK
jgi:CheY-like chemotaxis protein